MADFNVTINETLNVLGIGPPSVWGELVWGVGFWGAGSLPVPVSVTTIISQTFSLTDSFGPFDTDQTIDESMVLLGTNLSEELIDSDGYNYVFIGDTTNAENRSGSIFTQVASGTASWTSGTDPSTIWS